MARAIGMDKKFEIEDAARTLVKAEEIKSNKGLMPSVKKELAKQSKAIFKAAGKVSRRR